MNKSPRDTMHFFLELKRIISSKIDWLLLLCVYAFDVLYTLKRGKILLDADMASEMVLSDILNKERSISGLTTSWIYSTELRFLQTQWFYRIGLALSPSNWHVARTIAVALMLLLLAFAVWLLFYSCERRDIAIYAASLALLPGGSWYFWQTIFGSYYFPYLCISLMSISFVVLASKTSKSLTRYVYIAIIVFLGISSGINGVKQLMVFNTPFVIALFAVIIFQIRNSEFTQGNLLTSKEWKMLVLSVLSFVTSAIGYVINSKFLSQKYYFKQFDDNTIGSGSILDMLRQYIWSFGYNEGTKLLSVEGVGVMFGVIIGFLTLISGWRLIRNFKTLQLFEKVIVATACSSILFCIFIFTYVGGDMQYFQPILPFGLFLILIDICHEKYVLKYTKNKLEKF